MKQQLLNPDDCVSKTVSAVSIKGHCAVIAFDDSSCFCLSTHQDEDCCPYITPHHQLDPLEYSEGQALVEAGAISKAELASLRDEQNARTLADHEKYQREEYLRLRKIYENY